MEQTYAPSVNFGKSVHSVCIHSTKFFNSASTKFMGVPGEIRCREILVVRMIGVKLQGLQQTLSILGVSGPQTSLGDR